MILTVLVGMLTTLRTVPGIESAKNKRIINGIPLRGRAMGYDAVRYYTWLGNGHECDVPAPTFLQNMVGSETQLAFSFSFFGLIQCAPSPNNLLCSGSLITPRIVQTACHCVATFPRTEHTIETVPAILKSTWETLMRVYVGANSVDLMKTGVPAKAYMAHQKCSTLRRYPYWITHDFGWVTLKYSMLEDSILKNSPITFAPAYNLKSLVLIWHYITSKGAVCLYIGFGAYARGKESTKSPQFLHGWGRSIDYTSCYYLSKPAQHPPEKPFNFAEDATWMCALPFQNHDQRPGNGDSGGPVTCDNLHISLVSQGNRVHTSLGREDLSLSSALAYSVFENAAEYRRAFEEAVKDYDGYREQNWMPVFRPENTLS